MATSYSVREWYGKFIIMKSVPDNAKKLYLRSIKNGATVWYCDPLYARPYAYTTAMRYLKNFRANDPDCYEDC